MPQEGIRCEAATGVGDGRRVAWATAARVQRGSINSPLPAIKADQGATATGLQGEKRGTAVGGTPVVPETEG